jgi:D-xylonolactonase
MLVETVFDLNIEHGEGPLWDNTTNSLYWVDIFAGDFYKGDPATGVFLKKNIGQPIGTIALRQETGIVFAAHEGFGYTSIEENKPVIFFNNPQTNYPETRFNDGKVDPLGNFMAGTMTFDGQKPIGQLFQLRSNHTVQCLENELMLSNGMDWSPNGSQFFFADTVRQVIYQYDYNLKTGSISNRSNFIEFKKDEFPDGFCMDTAGNFWVAMWGSSKILQFNDQGKRIAAIDLPVTYPTSCCFGGADLSTLYITTSKIELSETERIKEPLAGKILKIETNSKGQLMRRYQG